jgi:hypothetical protein
MSKADDMSEAAKKLARNLIAQFNASGSQLIFSVSTPNKGAEGIVVRLARDPDSVEKDQLPGTYDSFSVTYKVGGRTI